MDSAADIIAACAELSRDNANEAETRLKIINRVLFEVLGWTHTDVSVEEHVSEDCKSTYADYIIRVGMTALIIEAKKANAVAYDLPDTRRIKLDRRLLDGELGDAVRQARDYARKCSIPFAVVTNGHQWVVFPATRIDQVTFEESTAVVFPSLQSALDHDVLEFKALLSRSSAIGGSLENELLGRIENQLEQRRLNAFFTTPFSKLKRSTLYHLVEEAISKAFSEDIVNVAPELLELLYVQTAERVRFDSRIQMHIARRQLPLAKQARRPMKSKDSNALAEIIQAAGSRTKGVAVLVLGTVGAGKTTFLTHTREVSAADQFAPNNDAPYPHWIYMDFRKFAPDESPVDFLFARLKEYIQAEKFLSDYQRCLQHAYRDEIEALKRGPWSPVANDSALIAKNTSDLLKDDWNATIPYVEKILKFAAAKAPVFLVIDNVDQFESKVLQPTIFSASIALAHRLNLNLVLAMRDDTYVDQKTLPAFDAFDFDPLYVDPPNIEAVLSRRFFVAKKLLKGKASRFVAENGADVSVSDTSIIVDLLQASVLGTQVGSLIEVLATSDVRLALRVTREFLQYGYTATEKALKIYHETGKFTLPPHEALRAIMLGNNSVYADHHSVIGNPFDAKLGRTEAQLLRLFVTAGLVNLSANANFQYLPGTEIISLLGAIGFGDDIAVKVLADLCKYRFIHTVSHGPASAQASFIPTRLGGYVVRKLIGDLTFVEGTMMDTFIADGVVWREMRESLDAIYAEGDPVARLKLRAKASTTFFTYMRSLFEPLVSEAIRRSLPKEWCSNPLSVILTDFQSNLQQALYSAEKNYPDSLGLTNSSTRNVSGRVKWFDAKRGFGFVGFKGKHPEAFISITILRRSGFSEAPQGSTVTGDLVQAERGWMYSSVSSVTLPRHLAATTASAIPVLPGTVRFFDERRRFGFVAADGDGGEVFVPNTALEDSGISKLEAGQRVNVVVSMNNSGMRAELIELIR